MLTTSFVTLRSKALVCGHTGIYFVSSSPEIVMDFFLVVIDVSFQIEVSATCCYLFWAILTTRVGRRVSSTKLKNNEAKARAGDQHHREKNYVMAQQLN